MDKIVDKTAFVLALIMAEYLRFLGRSKIARVGFEFPVPQVCSGEDVTCPGGGGPTADPHC
jgi:hypothetical protein